MVQISGVPELELENDGLVWKGHQLSYRDVTSVSWFGTITQNSINGIPTGKSYEANLRLHTKRGGQWTITGQSGAFGGLGKRGFEGVAQAAEIISELTFVYRVRSFERSVQEKKFFQYGDFQFHSSGIVFKNGVEHCNINSPKAKFFLQNVFSLTIIPEKVKSSIWGFFKDNSVKIVLHRDRDCMFHMLNQLYGVQFRDVRLRTKRYSQREVFYRAVVQIGALIASADGMAESRELLRLKHFFGLSSDEFPESAQLYNLQLEAPQSVEQILQEFRECFSEADQLKETFLFGMAEVAMSDGVADPAEIELLWRLARYLEIEEHIVVQILESAGIRTGKRGDAGTSNFAGTLSRSRCCAILGVDIDATGEQIRFAYREMVRRYHPDVLRSQQLPEEELERAGILIRRINEAYEFLKDSS